MFLEQEISAVPVHRATTLKLKRIITLMYFQDLV